ncbi:hypothetical protein [Nonomuraea gerenzanensis]|uniref:Secreted protein n=1 Tax=Nonomuraea gerenzanensis TaxID=93944 RepID=A0A1M4EDG7_9ACTN|nr:hypothetical protein [Nonomuraea gerenzanensis]UBU08660.1 hypothetical protein LCN96_30200 [Nonomuraea gerenzanensis]SBO97021.1 hypothetical protein BN4615_P6537 [Nonomuraea gerenzanensis]
MRKARAVLVTAVMALGVSLTVGATPAQAEGERLAGVFRDYSECQRIGNHGIAQGWWDDFSCEWEGRYRYYFLYA